MTAVPNPYFLYPFAIDGSPYDVVKIDNTGGTTGPMSYQYGFTPNYEEDLSSIASALPVPRPQFNQLMLDITAALQQLQLQGAPLWVAPASGSPPVGGPAEYPLYARVSYNPGAPYGLQIWESQVAANISIPGANSDWAIVSGNRGLAPGAYIDSASPNGYPGALLCDGAAYLRLDYPLLFQALTFTATCITNSIVNPTVITVPSNVIALVSAFNVGTTIACIVEGSPIPSGAYITAVGSTTITISAAATSSGSFDLTFLPYGWGNGGDITTFGVPNCLRTVSVAAGGSGNAVLGNKIANKGGADDYYQKLTDIYNHTHGTKLTAAAAGTGLSQGLSATITSSNTVTTRITGRVQSGPIDIDQTGMNIIQQSNVVFRYVKY